MITGKDENRVMFARLIGLKNFNEQIYKNKRLIIVNHGKIPIMTGPQENVYEIIIDKGDMTLGDLRNYAFDLVPINELVCIFDDDDWRKPDYIEFMVSKLLKTKSIAVFMKNRMEYNLANGFTFKSQFKDGNTHIMCIKLDRLRYTSLDTLEDVLLKKDLQSFKKKYTAIDNDPTMYIRIIHQNNTSPYAKDNRTEIINYPKNGNYQEYNSTEEEKTYVAGIIKQYYGFFLYNK
jgi:hypothetical protein